MKGVVSYTTRRYSLFAKLLPEDAVEWDHQVSDALNMIDSSMSSSEAYFELMRRGVENTLLGSADQSIVESTAEAMAERKVLAQLMQEKAGRRRIIQIYEEMGLDRFVEWCDSQGRDWQALLNEYTLEGQAQSRSWSEAALAWLHRYLRQSGGAAPTQQVREAAIKAGVVQAETADRDWAKLRQVAHRDGLTSGPRHGHWQEAGHSAPPQSTQPTVPEEEELF